MGIIGLIVESKLVKYFRYTCLVHLFSNIFYLYAIYIYSIDLYSSIIMSSLRFYSLVLLALSFVLSIFMIIILLVRTLKSGFSSNSAIFYGLLAILILITLFDPPYFFVDTINNPIGTLSFNLLAFSFLPFILFLENQVNTPYTFLISVVYVFWRVSSNHVFPINRESDTSILESYDNIVISYRVSIVILVFLISVMIYEYNVRSS